MRTIEFHVVNGSNQVEAKPKTFATVSIAIAQNAEDFQLANDVLDQNALLRQSVIAGLLALAQRVKLGFLGRRSAIRMKFDQSLIARISQNLDTSCQRCAAIFE